MFDVDNGSGRYGNSLSCHLNPKSPALLNTVSKAMQLFNELFRRIVLLNVAFGSMLACCHLHTSARL